MTTSTPSACRPSPISRRLSNRVGAGWGNIVQFTTYLVHSQDIPKFMKYRLREFPKMFSNAVYPPNTLLMVDRLVQEPLLVEVQAVAAL